MKDPFPYTPHWKLVLVGAVILLALILIAVAPEV